MKNTPVHVVVARDQPLAPRGRPGHRIARRGGPFEAPGNPTRGPRAHHRAGRRSTARIAGTDLPVGRTGRRTGTTRTRGARRRRTSPAPTPSRSAMSAATSSRTSRTTATISTSRTRSTAACRVSLTQSLRVFTQSDRVRYDALYGQDQWTMGRMTLQGALRFDHAWSYSPEQTIGPAIDGQTFLATPLTLRAAPTASTTRTSRRAADGACDVFGNGKTADQGERRQIRGSGEQPEQQLLDQQPDRAHRDHGRRATWTGDGTERRAIHTSRSATSRTTLPTASAPRRPARRSARRRRSRRPSIPNLLNGWGIRPNDWQIGASVQQQLAPRVSVEVGYFQRWLQNFTATDNLPVVAPPTSRRSASRRRRDPRLPGGGSYAVTDLYNVVQAEVRPDSQQHHRCGQLR